MACKKTLTRRQLHVLPFLISNPTIESAAKQSGISPKQIFAQLDKINQIQKKLVRHANFNRTLVLEDLLLDL